MKGTESSYNEERTKCAQEIQELRKKVGINYTYVKKSKKKQ